MEEDLQTRIYEKESEIDDLRKRGDEIYNKIIKDAATCLKAWYNEYIDKYIISNPTKINSKSEDQIRRLKREISAFSDSFERLISESLNKGEKTWHKRYDDEIVATEDVIEKIVQQALTHVVNAAKRKMYHIGNDSFEFVPISAAIPPCENLNGSISDYKDLYLQVKPELETLKKMKMDEEEQEKKKRGEIAKEKWNRVR
jgi:hypothetical protein